VETVWLKTIYVLFFIQLGTRRIQLAGCTSNPNQIWVSQQARQLVCELTDHEPPKKAFLIHDHNSKFTAFFDRVFSSESIEVIRTPDQAPRANAFAVRWVCSAREECLDHLLIINERHLRRILNEYLKYYNFDRLHQGINQHFPISGPVRHTRGSIRRQDILGGSSTMTTCNPQRLFLLPYRVFAPYRSIINSAKRIEVLVKAKYTAYLQNTQP
jgi:putative transposase